MATLPRRFGPYLLLQRLARGGMGEIYLGQKSKHQGGRYVALKSLRQDLTRDKEYVTRFLDEARVAIILNHPGINRVFDVGFAEGTYFLELEYISGRDVRTFLERARDLERPIPLEVTYYLVGELLEALAYLHEAKDISGIQLNLVHRDVSPQNAMASWGGDITLIDFGLARFAARRTETEPGMVMGKLRYMAPEQARGAEFDQRVDLFAVGVIFYEMLCGRRLYEDVDAATLWEVVARGRALEGVRFDKIPKETHPIVRRSLAIDAADRYPDGETFLADIRRLSNADKDTAKASLSTLLADLFEVDLRVEQEFMDELGRIAPFDLSSDEGTQSVSLADPSMAIPKEPTTSNPFSIPSPPTSPTDTAPAQSAAGGRAPAAIATQETKLAPQATPAVVPPTESGSDEGLIESGPFAPVTEPAYPRGNFDQVETQVPRGRTARIERAPAPAAAASEQTAPRSLNDERTMLMSREGAADPAAGAVLPPSERRLPLGLIAAVVLVVLLLGVLGAYLLRGGGGDAVEPPDDPPLVAVIDPKGDVPADPGEREAGAADDADAGVADHDEDPVGELPAAAPDGSDREDKPATKPRRTRPGKRRRPPRATPSHPTRTEKKPAVRPSPEVVSTAAPVDPKPQVSEANNRKQAKERARAGKKRLTELARGAGLSISDVYLAWPSTKKIQQSSTEERVRQELLSTAEHDFARFTFNREFIRKKLKRVQSRYMDVSPRLDDSSGLAKGLSNQQRAMLEAYNEAGDDPAKLRKVNRLLNAFELSVKLAGGK